MPHEFYRPSWIILALVLGAMGLMVAGLINTVGIELISFALGAPHS
ncbi:MAG: hypothetical protein IPK16_30670 [Anaerolineales bacterium]|nr:hypothetical protein [Anaerolineales bacterium]